jgi:AraC-like DNA-binding protein
MLSYTLDEQGELGLGIGYGKWTGGRGHAIHTHDFHELVIATQGSGVQHINENEYFITAGDVFVLKGRVTHGYSRTNGLEFYNLSFDNNRHNLFKKEFCSLPGYYALFEIEPNLNSDLKPKDRLKLDTSELAHAVGICLELHKEFLEKKPGYEIGVLSNLNLLILYLSRIYIKQQNKSKGNILPMTQTLMYIERNYRNNLDLNTLASTAGMSVSNFLRVFNKSFDQSPIEYVNRFRISKACSLLSEGGDNLTQIAMEVGFSDSNYFSRTFRKVMNTSPREFRRSLANENKTI